MDDDLKSERNSDPVVGVTESGKYFYNMIQESSLQGTQV